MTRPEYQPGDRVALTREMVRRGGRVTLAAGTPFTVAAAGHWAGSPEYTIADDDGGQWTGVPESCLRPADGSTPPSPPPPKSNLFE